MMIFAVLALFSCDVIEWQHRTLEKKVAQVGFEEKQLQFGRNLLSETVWSFVRHSADGYDHSGHLKRFL